MTGKTLYDSDGQQFYPYSDADYIASGVVLSSNNLKKDLLDIWSKALSAYNYATGGQTVSGSLQVDVYYKNSTENSEALIISEGDTGWSANMTTPGSTAPYCWKRTRYYWKVSENEEPSVIKTIYEICATALYPETQTMYAVTTQVNSSDITGPIDYSNSAAGVADQNTGVAVQWFDHFKGISPTETMGFMATRHREAGEAWPLNGGWHVALFAVYPTN